MGRERTTKGGIVIPATTGAKIRTRSDVWRGRVLAKGPDAPPDLEVGEDVLAYTYAGGDGSKLYSGDAVGGHRLFVRPDDIVCQVAPDAEVSW